MAFSTDAEKDVNARVGVYKATQLLRRQFEGRFLEQSLHLTPAEHAQVPSALVRAAVALPSGDLLKEALHRGVALAG